jgi:hypothetical protein
MAAVLLLCFLYFLLASTAFYLIGTLILKPLGYKVSGFYSDIFDKSLTGLVACVFLYSICASTFKTVQWGILLVALFLWYELKITRKNRITEHVYNWKTTHWSLKSILPLLLLAILVFAWFAYPTFNWTSDFMYAMPHKDKVYYSNIATALSEFGNENRQGAYVPGATQSATEPYHYFDLWFAALLSFVTSKPSIVVISLLCLPVCSLISICGILSVFERNFPLKTWHYLIAFLLLFTRGIYLEIRDPQIAWAENFSEGILEFKSEKLGVLYLFAILSFRFLFNGNLSAALTSLLALPVISIGNLPGIIGGILVFTIFAVFTKRLDRYGAMRIAAYCGLIFIFVYLFYRYTSDANSNAYLEKGLMIFTDINEVNLRSVKIAAAELFVRIMNNPWRATLIHLPFLLVAAFALKQNKQMKYAFLLIACICLVSLSTYGFFYKLVDAPQFYTNNLPVLNVFLILSVSYFLSSEFYPEKFRMYVASGLTVILMVIMIAGLAEYRASRSFTELYSDKYLCEIDSVHKRIREKSGIAVIYDPQQKPDLYNCDMSGPNLLFQPLFTRFRVPVDINIMAQREMPWGGEMGEVQKRFLNKAPFKQFVLQQMSVGQYKEIGESQLEYLRRENIQYVFVSQGVEVDRRIVARVRKQIKDQRSGEQLLVLNPWQ